MENTDIQKKVLEFIARETGISEKKLFLHSRLLQDLEVDGDDAYELFVKFSKSFNVDLSNFDLSKYFNSEWGAVLDLLKSPFSLLAGSKAKFEAITVSDLVNAAKKRVMRV